MPNLQCIIKSYLIRLNVDPTHIGYRQMIDCIEIRITEQLPTMGAIYAVAAIKYGVKPKSVMRNITYALDHVTDLASSLSEILGFTVDDNSLHNGRVIFYIADLITEPSLFDFSA